MPKSNGLTELKSVARCPKDPLAFVTAIIKVYIVLFPLTREACGINRITMILLNSMGERSLMGSLDTPRDHLRS